MWLTDLSEAVQKSGLVVHEVSGWKTRGHGSFIKLEGIVEHHTAGPKTGNAPSLHVVTYGRPGLAGPLCNLLFARDGSVYVVAAGVAWHAGVGSGYGFPANMANFYAIGIEAESTGRGDWTQAQLDAWPRLNNALAGHYTTIKVKQMIGHYEWTPRKIDPYGLPGGMTWLRTASAKPTTTEEDDDMTTTMLYNNTSLDTPLVENAWRTVKVTDKGNVSVAKGPARVTGVISMKMNRKADVRVESYVAKPDGKGGWVYYASQGYEDFSQCEMIRYSAATKLPATMVLRFRVMQLDAAGPLSIIQTTYNLDARS